jgi:hypothetical protein
MAYTNFKPTIWSEHIQRQLERDCLFWDCCNHEFEGEAKRGEKVKIVGHGRPTIGDYTGADIGAPETVADNAQFLEITQAKFFNFAVDDVDKAQSIPGLMDSLMAESAAAMAQTRDEFIAKVAATGATNISDALTITDEDSAKAAIDDAFTTLWGNDVPVSDVCSIILPPWFYQNFRGCMQGLSTDNPKLLERGVLGKYTNGNVKLSNSLHNDGTYDYAVVMTKRAVAVAGQINEVEAYRPEGLFADAVKGLDTYGAKVVRPEQLYIIKCTKG